MRTRPRNPPKRVRRLRLTAVGILVVYGEEDVNTPYLHVKKHPAWGTSSLKQAQREARQWLNQQKTPHTKLRSNLFAAGCAVLEHPQQGCIARIEITSRVMARKE